MGSNEDVRRGTRHMVSPFPFDDIVKYLTNMSALSPVLPREHLHYITSVEDCQGGFVKKFFVFWEKGVDKCFILCYTKYS